VSVAGINPDKGVHAVRQLVLEALQVQAAQSKLAHAPCAPAINSPKMFPLYAKCIELGVLVNFHCGINFSTESLIESGRPILLDQVMMHFQLFVCAPLLGWPWAHKLTGVAGRH
jgi:uncharacterized protein